MSLVHIPRHEPQLIVLVKLSEIQIAGKGMTIANLFFTNTCEKYNLLNLRNLGYLVNLRNLM